MKLRNCTLRTALGVALATLLLGSLTVPAVSASAAPSLEPLSGVDSPSAPATTRDSSTVRPRMDGIGWTKAPNRIGPGRLKGVIGRHTVVVVPQTANVRTPLDAQKRVLRQVADFWRAAVPGMSIRFVLKKPVQVTKEHCLNAGLAWDTAARVAGSFNPYAKFNHLAAIVDCGMGSGLGDVREGSGRIMVNAWSAEGIAHEFGHNLGLYHANEIGCPDWRRPNPQTCSQMEYADFLDVMGGGGMLPLDARSVLGLWRAWFVGVQRLPSRTGGTVTLERSRLGTMAKPLALSTSLGAVFLDAGSEGTTYDDCPYGGVEMRVASSDGNSAAAGQARLSMVTVTGEEIARADFLDAFDIPGTKRRAVVTQRNPGRVTVAIRSRSGAAPTSSPDLGSFSEGMVLLTEGPRSASFDFPRAEGILGYRVEDASSCLKRVAPGSSAFLSLGEGVNNVKITPVGMNGMPGETVIKRVSAGFVRVAVPAGGTFLEEVDGLPITWDMPSDQPNSFIQAVTGWRIVDEYEDETLAELPASARSWDPWPDIRSVVPVDACGYVYVAALSGDEIVGRSEGISLCRFS